MIEFIISILVPILGGLGVSEADVTTYVTNCSGYIYAILISILVLIVLLVAAHFIAPKGKRHLVRWGASLAWVLALVTMVNMVCYGPLYTNLSVVLNGGGTVSDEAKAASNEVIKKVGEEGMVLVKNNGLLPLSSDVDSMNVFGWASTNPIYGGTGSGSADTSYDDPMWDQLLDQMSFEDMSLLVNLGGWQTAQIDSVGKVATSDCDGPAGVNNFITGTYGTPYPTEVLMAQTWNTDLLYDLGLAMGQEYADVNNYGVYGPAMNTHRSAFAGRNFEYYSEDGVLAGKLAAAQVNAMATKGTYNYIKHFALNDQETNRCAFLLTYSNEQAIREIYLKPFELCIKNFDGTQIAVMSSFNWIGTVPACANEDTLTTILRNEWGFQGMVITDYDGSYGYMITDHCVRTGNDLMLGFSSQASNQLTNTESATLNNALRTSCKNIMYTIANSGYYTNTTDDSGMSNMTKLFVTIDVVTVLLVVLCMALVIVRYRKKHAKTTAEVTPEEKKEE